jgi:hypothetical protein
LLRCTPECISSADGADSSEPVPEADISKRSSIMGKGNKPHKKEIKKPKKDKKAAKK